MDRRLAAKTFLCGLGELIFALALGVLATPLANAQAQKAHRIGWLMPTPSASAPSRLSIDVFRGAMRTLGYVQGQNLVIEERYAETGPGQLSELAADLVGRNVSVIVSGSSDGTAALQRATASIAVVMAVSAAPVEQGFVASLARPGGNITGLSMASPEVAEKRLELLKRLAPKIARVAVLRTPISPTTELAWQQTEAAARRLGLTLQSLEVEGPAPDLDRLFAAAVSQKAEAVIALPDARLARHGTQIAALAAKHRLPSMFFERTAVEAGGLVSYGPNIPDLFVRAASYVDKLLKGAKPGDLPVEEPREFDLILNLKTAKALGITVPDTLRIMANDVIQ